MSGKYSQHQCVFHSVTKNICSNVIFMTDQIEEEQIYFTMLFVFNIHCKAGESGIKMYFFGNKLIIPGEFCQLKEAETFI